MGRAGLSKLDNGLGRAWTGRSGPNILGPLLTAPIPNLAKEWWFVRIESTELKLFGFLFILNMIKTLTNK